MKKVSRILKVFLILMMMSCSMLMNTTVFAVETRTSENSGAIYVAKNDEQEKKVDAQSIINAGGQFIKEGEEGAKGITGMGVFDFLDAFSGIGQILVAIGTVTLLIVGAIMAVQWITATPEKQAKLKGQLIGLVVSAVVIYGALGIWSLVKGIGEKAEKEIENNVVVTESRIDI